MTDSPTSRNGAAVHRRDLFGVFSLVWSIVPGVVLMIVGLGLALLADSLVLRVLGMVVAGIPLISMDIESLKRSLMAVMILEVAFPIDVYLSHQMGTDFLHANSPVNAETANVLAGFNVSVATICLIVLYALWAVEALGETSFVHRGRLRRMVPAFAYTVAVLASVLVAGQVTLALFEVVLILQALLLLAYLVHAVGTPRDLLLVITLLMMGLIAQASLGVAQATLGVSIELGPLDLSGGGARVGGALGSPNALGSYLTLLIPIGVTLLLARVPLTFKYLGGGGAALATLALVLTGSRGAWLGLVAALFLVGLLAHLEGWLRTSTLASVAMIAAVVIGVLFGNVIIERFETGATVEGRLDLIEIAAQVISDAPISGVGANNFAAVIDPYVTVDYSRSWISTVHNKYLLVWAETGLVGIITYLWLLFSSLRMAWQSARGGSLFLSPLAAGLLGAITANMVHMFVSIFHGRSQIQMLWLAIGLVIAVAHLMERESALGPE